MERTLVICALKFEFETIRNQFSNDSPKTLDTFQFEFLGIQRAKFEEKLSNITTDRLYQRVLLVGGAGALRPNLKIGDVVVASEIVRGDQVEARTPAKGPALIDISSTKKAYDTHVGPIVTVTSPVASKEERGRIRNQTGGIAVAMEGWFVSEIAKKMGCDFLEIRLITDLADKKIEISDYKIKFSENVKNICDVLSNLRLGQ